ncbi:MAG: cspB [Anaerocolumna sp.]|jgi:CspA family cold shock protein|nr:cspB [Anaerocolumna sp.]
MNKGIVKFFDIKKGWGFINFDGKDVFVHHSGILADGFKKLTEGERVMFDISQSPKGLMAINVTKAE